MGPWNTVLVENVNITLNLVWNKYVVMSLMSLKIAKSKNLFTNNITKTKNSLYLKKKKKRPERESSWDNSLRKTGTPSVRYDI